jgi:hypothetical protein
MLLPKDGMFGPVTILRVGVTPMEVQLKGVIMDISNWASFCLDLTINVELNCKMNTVM